MPASFVTPVTTLPAGEPGPLRHARQRQRLHPRAVDDARRDRGAAAQRASRSDRRAAGRRSVRDRSVVAPRARGVAAARRRAPGPAARRAARLSRRAPAARDRRRQRPQHGSLHRAAAPAGAARRACRRRRDRRRSKPSPPNNVVDGLVLHRRWKEERSAVIAELQPRRTRGTSDSAATHRRYSTALGDAIDGLSDALTAESAYQMVRGNTSRTASTLAAIAQGDAPPPGARSRPHAAIGHVADASPAAPDERPRRRTRQAGSRSISTAARERRADAQLLGVQAARRRHARSAARSSGSTTRPAPSSRRARCR